MYFRQAHLKAYERRSNYSATFFVSRSNTKFELSVKFRTILYKNDTASHADFENVPSKDIDFARDQDVSQGSVLIYFDDLNETAETFHIKLLLGSDYRLGSPSVIMVTIENHISGNFSLIDILYDLIDSICCLDISIGFKQSNYSIKEGDPPFKEFELHRSGNTSFALTVKIHLTQAEGIIDKKRFLFATEVIFEAGQSTVIEYGHITDDSIYQGTQYWGTYCLVSQDHKNSSFDMKFSIQCMGITISDEEDCKLIHIFYICFTYAMHFSSISKI